MATVSGIDVSVYNQRIDWAQVYAAGYRFAAVRATLGEKPEGVDANFAINFDGARKAGMLVTAYHVIKPKYSAASQMDRLFSTLAGRVPDLPLVMDVEVTDDIADRAVISRVVRECCQITAAQSNRNPIIYTAQYFWNDNILTAPDWSQYDLWIANYGVTSPNLPRDWKTWRFWQTTDRGTVPGVPSRYCDLNVFNGTEAELLAYAQAQPAQPQQGLRAKVTALTLNIRSGPGVNFPDIGDLKQGDVVPILNLTGKNMWLRIGEDRWCAFALDHEPFVTLEPGSPTTGRALYLLNVRSGPTTSAQIVARLQRGESFKVEAFSGRDVWVEFAPGQWAAFAHRGTNYMQLV